MKPRIKLAEAELPTGGMLALFEHDGAYAMSFRGQELMHSRMTTSETLLGKLGAKGLQDRSDGRVLIGGLGLGFTLRAVFESTDRNTQIDVAELVPDVIEWNRTHLQQLHGQLLVESNVNAFSADVGNVIRNAADETYDAILLDVDNGPVAMVSASNEKLYSKSGLSDIHSALKPGGIAIFWSAGPDAKFESKLKAAGFATSSTPAKTHAGAKRAAYVLYQATKTIG